MKTILALALCLASTAAALPDSSFDADPSGLLSLKGAPAATVAGKAVDSDSRLWVVINAAGATARSAVAETGVSIEVILGGQVMGIATPKAVAELKKAGIAIESSRPLNRPVNNAVSATDFPKADSPFHNYAETVAELSALESVGRGLVSLLTVGKSLQGRDILAVRLNTTESGAAPSAKPGIIFMGNHHAREHLSNEVPLLLAKYLVDNRAKPEIAALLDKRDIYIIPMVNPDGVEYDISGDRYRMHRKNMRRNANGTTGVDLNRNYGFHWGEGGASSDPGSETFRGPNAFSEPESQAIRDFVEARPNLKVLLSYHTFSELILYPWGHSNSPISESGPLAAYKAMAKAMADMTGYTDQQSSDLYIASGDTVDWAWGARKIFAFTFELTPKSMWEGGFYPGAKVISMVFQNNIRPALYLIDLADNPERAGQNAATTKKTVSQTHLGGR